MQIDKVVMDKIREFVEEIFKQANQRCKQINDVITKEYIYGRQIRKTMWEDDVYKIIFEDRKE